MARSSESSVSRGGRVGRRPGTALGLSRAPGGRAAALGLALALVTVAVPAVSGEEPRDERIERELRELRERVAELERELGRGPEAAGERGEEQATPGEGAEPGDEGESGLTLSPVWSREALETPGALRGIYDKPFLASFWRRAHVGGYTEIEYHSFEDGTLEVPEGFRMHRTNLFLFTEVSDRVHFASEIEFETEFEGDELSSDIEVAVEMAFIDWVLFEELALRIGALLPPLGRVNVNHDGPVRELTGRPLVSTFVIPTTLTEPGVGAHGSLSLHEELSLTYEAYAVNGFNVLDRDGELSVDVTDVEKVLREGRTSLGGDINGGVAGTGRVGMEALDRIELGGSWHIGTYDEKGDNLLWLLAGDLAFVQPLEWAEVALEGEIAVADFERDDFARTAGVPDRFWGYFVQASVGGMPPFMRRLPPRVSHLFEGEGARFTVVVRYDRVDLDGDVGEAIEPGINFRPVADTVFKFSYRFAQKSIGLRNLPGRSDWDDEGFVFSMSTYF